METGETMRDDTAMIFGRETVALMKGFGAAARACGEADFFQRLLDAASPLVDWECRAVARYSRETAPVYLIDEGADPEVIELYLRGYYRVDPYYAAFAKKNTARMMVLSRDLRREDANPYIMIFTATARWTDEIGILLPCADGSAIGVFWEVLGRTFRASEIADIEAVYPLIVGLHEAHDRRLQDRVRLDEAARVEASPRRPMTPALRPVTVEDAMQSFIEGIADAALTPRELEIVQLSLAGLSNTEIAGKLGLEVGSVKNHRGRLYKKLGIAGERDLFRLFLDHLSAMADE